MLPVRSSFVHEDKVLVVRVVICGNVQKNSTEKKEGEKEENETQWSVQVKMLEKKKEKKSKGSRAVPFLVSGELAVFNRFVSTDCRYILRGSVKHRKEKRKEQQNRNRNEKSQKARRTLSHSFSNARYSRFLYNIYMYSFILSSSFLDSGTQVYSFRKPARALE